MFLIPTFQRRYTWRKEQWEQLWNDLLIEYGLEHPDDPEALYGHFLGSVVLHPALGPASTLMRHQVIDGQQRLTTILILLAALRDVRKEADPTWNPGSIDDQYLRNPFSTDFPDRLVPTKLDREAYERTVRLQDPTGDIGVAYNFFKMAIERAMRTDDLSLDRLENTLLLNMLLVEITTKTGDSVNSIFNTLNSKGMDLSAADLVRNEVLHHIGTGAADEAHSEYWVPMEVNLVTPRSKSPDREFVTFLWSREVAINPKTSRDDLFSKFEKRLRVTLNALPAQERNDHALGVLQEMYDDHLLFLIVRDPARGQADSRIARELLESLQTLKDWRSEPATPVALWLLKAAMAGDIEQSDAAAAIDVLMSYLVKRTLNGVPTNQLNRLLTPVAHDLAQRGANESVSERMRLLLSKQGYYWPTDDQVRAAVVGNPIYASARRYVKFLLSVAEERLPGMESADLSKSQIEHVMPQSLSGEWRAYFESADIDLSDAEALTHTLGNLTLTDNNQRMGNSSFKVKTQEFFDQSALRLNRALAEMPRFYPADIQARSESLANSILERFHHQPLASSADASQDESGASVRDRLQSLLQSLPVTRWVTEDDLVAVLGAAHDDIREIVATLDATLARLIRTESKAIPTWLPGELKSRVADQDRAQFDLGKRMQSEELSEFTAKADRQDGDPDDTGDTFDDEQ
ncbi:DUF262 domain-containing HNH endonuclease family protein [Nocardioides coralli]|nr:DUF262 domain-containing HNH endonuclease family protein [Nocardioides coralli]